MPLNLPDAIHRFFVVGAFDITIINQCFDPEALVIDEQQQHAGHTEIAHWRKSTGERYRYVAEPLSVARASEKPVIIARVVGDFPGSPAELRYAFALTDGTTSQLDFTA